jgi:hypothetical protein
MPSISQSPVHLLRSELRHAAHGPPLARLWRRAALEWARFCDRARQPAPCIAAPRLRHTAAPGPSPRWGQ